MSVLSCCPTVKHAQIPCETRILYIPKAPLAQKHRSDSARLLAGELAGIAALLLHHRRGDLLHNLQAARGLLAVAPGDLATGDLVNMAADRVEVLELAKAPLTPPLVHEAVDGLAAVLGLALLGKLVELSEELNGLVVLVNLLLVPKHQGKV